jgi:uncharacterized protein (TIGR02266 family)
MSLRSFLSAFLGPEENNATKPVEHRQFPRLSPRVKTTVDTYRVGDEEREYLEAIISNVSLGGMFIETAKPAAPGSVLQITFQLAIEDQVTTLKARALVRHCRPMNHRPGMGVEFIEFESLGRQTFEYWISKLKTE